MEPYRCIACIAKTMRTMNLETTARSRAIRPRNSTLLSARRTAQSTRSFTTTTRHSAEGDSRTPAARPMPAASSKHASPLAKLFEDATNAANTQTATTSRAGRQTPPVMSATSYNASTPFSPRATPGMDLFDLIAGSRGLNRPQPLKLEPAPFRLGPTLGRTVHLDGRDLGTALRRLNSLCASNNVRGQERKQRFHERPGMKRKRLKSERWRARFKSGFVDMVKRVQAMKKMGW